METDSAGQRSGADRWRQYHRILIDTFGPELFSGVLHSHEYTATGPTHQVSLSPAYKNIDQEV